MDQRIFIAQHNIDHLRRKLATEKDEATRKTIARLIFEAEAKLAALNDPPGQKKAQIITRLIALLASVGCASMRLFV